MHKNIQHLSTCIWHAIQQEEEDRCTVRESRCTTQSVVNIGIKNKRRVATWLGLRKLSALTVWLQPIRAVVLHISVAATYDVEYGGPTNRKSPCHMTFLDHICSASSFPIFFLLDKAVLNYSVNQPRSQEQGVKKLPALSSGDEGCYQQHGCELAFALAEGVDSESQSQDNAGRQPGPTASSRQERRRHVLQSPAQSHPGPSNIKNFDSKYCFNTAANCVSNVP